MARCQWNIPWTGQCLNKAGRGAKFCEEHKGQICVSCGGIATRGCDETYGLVCGAHLCDNCEHEIAEDGTNGARSAHCKKGEQKYYSWMYQLTYGVKERSPEDKKSAPVFSPINKEE